MTAQFVLAPPQSTSPAHTADVLGRSAAAAAILWNCHIAISGPDKFLDALTIALRVPPERPQFTPGTRYNGALLRLANRAHRIANELTTQTQLRRGPRRRVCQTMYVQAFNEYLSRQQPHEDTRRVTLHGE